MAQNLFLQNTIAIIWDFDKTLIPGYMQEPIFKHFGVNEKKFWDEVNTLPAYYRERGIEHINEDSIYLNHLLSYVRHEVFKGLNNEKLRELGALLHFYPGLPEFFDRTRQFVRNHPQFARHDIEVEHYVVSTGLRQMVLGSKIASHIDGVWACEFAEDVPGPGYLDVDNPQMFETDTVISEVAYVIDNTSKTRAIFEINKGVNKADGINVNSKIPDSERRVPFKNMIYIADGPSDVPVFSVVKQFGGNTFAVYKKGNMKEFGQVNNLQKQNRVDSFGEADYQPGSQTSMWIHHCVEEIAGRIVRDRELALSEKVGRPPSHLTDKEDMDAKPRGPVIEQLDMET